MSDEQNEIEAAAERMARISDWSNPAEVYGGEDYSHDYSADCATLCQWAVARLAADRAERKERERPIDHEWMIERFGVPSCESAIRGRYWSFKAIDRWASAEVHMSIRGSWFASMCQDDDVVVLKLATRGRLLDLLAAIVVERKGGGQ